MAFHLFSARVVPIMKIKSETGPYRQLTSFAHNPVTQLIIMLLLSWKTWVMSSIKTFQSIEIKTENTISSEFPIRINNNRIVCKQLSFQTTLWDCQVYYYRQSLPSRNRANLVLLNKTANHNAFRPNRSFFVLSAPSCIRDSAHFISLFTAHAIKGTNLLLVPKVEIYLKL